MIHYINEIASSHTGKYELVKKISLAHLHTEANYLKFQIFKAVENTENGLEVGDVAVGFLTNGTFIPFGKYLGGDIQDVTNSWDTSPMWLPNESGEEPGNDVGGVEPA